MRESSANSASPPRHPTFAEAVLVWLKIGLLSFGGPTGQIGLMHRELVEKRRWVGDGRFLHALNYCMLLPGPEAQQLAIYIGWLLHRTWGGIVAGALFVIPGAALMWLVSYLYVTQGDVPWIAAIFQGLKPAVMAIVAAAVLRIGRKALKTAALWSVSALAFIGIFFFDAPFPAIVLGAGIVGLVGGLRYPHLFDITGGHSSGRSGSGRSAIDTTATGDSAIDAFVIGDEVSNHIGRPTVARALGTAALWALIWAAPIFAVFQALGGTHVLSAQGVFFSKASLVTFGGAYAVLPYVAQQAVETHGWLSAPQMIDGLGLAETTPGPLILVLQFVGFLGGWNAPGAASPLFVATLAAALTSWATFVPGFLFIFTGGPFVESSRGNLRLNTALSAVTAAVVGVILNLAVWFGWHVIKPDTGLDVFALVASALFFVALQRWKIDVLWIVAAGAVFGLLFQR